jgi:hypothetical protein
MSPDESLSAAGAKKKPRRRRSMEKIALWLFGASSNPAPPECGFAGEGRQIALKPPLRSQSEKGTGQLPSLWP